MAIVRIRIGDTRPSLRGRCVDVDGNSADLTNATVQLKYKAESGGSLVTRSMVVETANDGRVRYDWISADTATAGTFNYTVRVTYQDGSTESFPGQGYEQFIVEPTLT